MKRHILVILVGVIVLTCTCPSSNLVVTHCTSSGRISDLQGLSFLSELHNRGEWADCVWYVLIQYNRCRRDQRRWDSKTYFQYEYPVRRYAAVYSKYSNEDQRGNWIDYEQPKWDGWWDGWRVVDVNCDNVVNLWWWDDVSWDSRNEHTYPNWANGKQCPPLCDY